LRYHGTPSADDSAFTILGGGWRDAYHVDITGGVDFGLLGAKGSIKLINVDTNGTMVELDFARSPLFVNTRATGKILNDYIVDVAACAVATVEGRRTRVVRQSQSSTRG